MVVMVKNGGTGGPTGQFQRPGGARFEPGSGTNKMVPNRNAQVTVEVGPAVVPIGSVAARNKTDHLEGAGYPGGEIVLGTNVIVQPRTNDEFIRGAGIPSYDGPISIAGNPEYGRGEADAFAGTQVPAWYPTYPMGTEPEDRSL